jgi:hypothetical protein
MKTIQKITLCLFTMVAISTWTTASAAVLDVNFIEGAEFAGVINGNAKFVGGAPSDNLIFSGSATGQVTLAEGTVKVASRSAFGSDVVMDGGNLQTTAAVDVPALVMTLPGTLTAGGAGALAGISGTAKLTVAGVGAVTPADLSRATNPVDVSGIVHVGATGSLLPSGAVTVKNAGLVKLMGVAVPDCVPGAMKVESGGILEVAPSLEVPAAGVPASGDLFGSLRFDTGSKLLLRGGVNWRRPVVIGSYS